MFSCTLNKSIASGPLALSIPGYSISMYNQVDAIASEWNAFAKDNLFLHSSFLSALEESPPSGTSYKYVLVQKEEELVGVVYFQVKKIDLYKSLRLDMIQPTGWWNKITHSIKSLFAKLLKANLLVLGNMTLTGCNGYAFKENYDDEKALEISKMVTQEVICKLKSEKTKIAAILLKDFYEAQNSKVSSFGYTEFKVQPNMILKLDKNWSTFEDYLTSMKSKYRVRVRRARKKAEGLERRVLSLEEIHAYSNEISALYKNVANQAGFNLFILPNTYFYSLQKHLKDNMELVGYFKGEKLVGYYTHIKSHGDLDAHFLGYDPASNKAHQLYLNMLYDLVNDAIRLNANSLIMSRTALEIKSSVGAEPHAMNLYIKANNSILNVGVAKVLNYFKPTENWVPRSPFK
ncbi:MAG: GNAT family N-acetyltransferase [Saprospiraceae bacterium]|nr:GNAT family N-acetyltransferase [Saprospiraceae bacterium]